MYSQQELQPERKDLKRVDAHGALDCPGESLSKASLPPVPKAEDKNGIARSIESKAEDPNSQSQDEGQAKREAWDRRAYKEPAPKKLLMRLLSPVNRLVMLYGIPLVRNIRVFNPLEAVRAIVDGKLFDRSRQNYIFPRIRPFEGALRIRTVHFDAASRDELREARDGKAACFITPNHPDYISDWLFDKELASSVAPYVATWAWWEIVNMSPLFQKFSLANNAIAAGIPGGSPGKEYSKEWAKTGEGVLLHPEGTVNWHGSKVGPLRPGVIDMALELANDARDAGSGQAVRIAPVLFRYRYVEDISYGLEKEMAKLEQHFELPNGSGMSMYERFVNLQVTLLEKKAREWNASEAFFREPITASNFFDKQDDFYNFLHGRLRIKFGRMVGNTVDEIRRWEKAAEAMEPYDPKYSKHFLAMITEVRRLRGFSRDVYETGQLSQDQVAESVMRLRKLAFNEHMFSPYGQRDAYIVSAAALEVQPFDAGDDRAVREHKRNLLEQLHERMQQTLSELVGKTDREEPRFCMENPFLKRQGL